MRNLLRQGSQWLARTRSRYAASEVTYQRGAASVRLRASLARQFYTTDDGSPAPVGADAWDFIVRAADVEVDGLQTEPAVGDRILVGEPEAAAVYEVAPQSGGRAWDFCDSFGEEVRIHCKKVGTQPPQP